MWFVPVTVMLDFRKLQFVIVFTLYLDSVLLRLCHATKKYLYFILDPVSICTSLCNDGDWSNIVAWVERPNVEVGDLFNASDYWDFINEFFLIYRTRIHKSHCTFFNKRYHWHKYENWNHERTQWVCDVPAFVLDKDWWNNDTNTTQGVSKHVQEYSVHILVFVTMIVVGTVISVLMFFMFTFLLIMTVTVTMIMTVVMAVTVIVIVIVTFTMATITVIATMSKIMEEHKSNYVD